MPENITQLEGTWDIGWEGHERAQLLRMAAQPLPLKLRWLEEAQVMVEHLQSQQKRRQALANSDEAPREDNHE
jgi:hypothetical protein